MIKVNGMRFLAFMCLFFGLNLTAEGSLSLFKKVEHNSLTFIPWQDEEWPQESFYDYLNRCMEYQRNPQEFKKRRLAFKALYAFENQYPQACCNVLNDATTWQDLCLFSGSHDAKSCLIEKIGRTKTEVGKATLSCMLANPSCDIQELEKRQAIIKELLENKSLFEDIDHALKHLERNEMLTLSFWSHDPLEQSAQRHYLNIPGLSKLNENLNRNDTVLEVTNIWDHKIRIIHAVTSAMAAVILPIYALQKIAGKKPSKELQQFASDLFRGGTLIAALKWGFSHIKHRGDLREAAHNGAMLGDGLLYSFSIKGNCEWVRDNIYLDMCLQEKLIAVAMYLENVRYCAQMISQSPLEQKMRTIPGLYNVLYELPKTIDELEQFYELMETSTFKGSSSLFSRKGRVLVAYKLMHAVKKHLTPLIAFIGELDAYMSAAHLYRDFQNEPVHYCFVDFVKKDFPLIDATSFWNSFIDVKKVVPNNLRLDSNMGRANMILTGPNAGGKSTILKATALALILAQTFGIAPAEHMTLTPFATIATYLNITDDIASGNSLFKAEVLRAQALVEKVQKLQDKQFSFVAIDEMFSGTSPEEGRAAAYSVAKHLGQFRNNISMIASHYPLLTNLAQDTPNFANFKVSVMVSPEGVISYPFKLEPGISDQHVAIDILQAEGFNNQILRDARSILKQESSFLTKPQ